MNSYNLNSSRLPRVEPNLNLKFSLKLLRYMGNWPPSGEPERNFYYVYSVVFFTLVIAIYLIVQVGFLIVVWGNYDRMIAGSFLLMTNTGNCYKMIVVLSRHERIQRLVDTVDSRVFGSDNVKYERIFSTYAWQGIIHHAAYQSLGGISICCWALGSTLSILKDGEKRLPVETWYPYDVTKSPNFEITCAQQIIGEMILCVQNIALDTLVTNFINVTCCQLEILKINVRSIGNEDGDFVNSNRKNDEAWEKLRSCIEHNKVIIRFKKDIQDIFGTAILYQCFVNCAIICLTAFHISQMKNYVPAELTGTGLYLCGMTYQIFIYCWHGNELTLHSEGVALAAYSGNWWKFDERYKSALRIIIIRSQRPLVLTVGRIIVLSLETFTSILRMSYSLFTVLQSSTTDEN